MSSHPQSAALTDKDERSSAEARELIERAYQAFLAYQNFSQEQVDRIVEAMAVAATANAETLARLAVEETGYGIVEDKVQKNLFSSQKVFEAIRGLKTVGVVREDPGQGIIEIAVPAGVVAAVLPTTNPTSTAIYKILIALKGRNTIVTSPHPSAMRCTCEAVSIMREAAVKAGAPPDVICCFTTPTMAGTQELMRHRRTSVILATGGMGMVRAAYSSGKPAFGVGPGNVPAFIDRSADIRKAVDEVVFGKTFDHGTICSSEQAIVAEEAVRDPLIQALKANAAHFLSAAEIDRLGREMVNLEKHTINPKYVGQSARRVAELAGFKVAEGTRLLVAQLDGVGREHPLSAEKLSPVLALYFKKDRAAAFDTCFELLRFGGLGHTCAIHARDEAVIREFGLRMPAGRIVVNTNAPLGSIGSTTNLEPAMTLGCGAVGGNITSDNISAVHLVNIKRVAYVTGASSRLKVASHPVASCRLSAPTEKPVCPCAAPSTGEVPYAAETDRTADVGVAVSRAVERFLATKRAAAPPPSPGPPEPEPKSAPPPAKLKPHPVEFVSEAEIRAAVKRKEKILVGSTTIITPAARDLAAEYDVLVHED